MDTQLIHNKLKEFEKSNPAPITIINYFKNRIIEIDKCLSTSEMDNAELCYRIEKDNILIDTLCKLLIITNNEEKLKLDFDDENILRAINLLADIKDRKNHKLIRSIATLISIADFEKFEFKTLKELIDYGSR